MQTMKSLKLLITITVLLILSSCSTVKEVPSYTEVRGFDFTKYTKEGFLFTPEGYSGRYESAGILSVRISPEIKRAFEPGDNFADFDRVQDAAGNEWIVEKPDTENAIETMYKQALEMGADALINFDISSEALTSEIPATIVIVNGFAIKRLD